MPTRRSEGVSLKPGLYFVTAANGVLSVTHARLSPANDYSTYLPEANEDPDAAARACSPGRPASGVGALSSTRVTGSLDTHRVKVIGGVHPDRYITL